jgi:hypothetical protein
VLDYYGRRLATCSSDKTIKIFEVEGETHRLTETLKGYVCALASPKWWGWRMGTYGLAHFVDTKELCGAYRGLVAWIVTLGRTGVAKWWG